MLVGDINVMTVIVAAAINILLGGLWYSTKLFGKDWMELAGITEEKIKSINLPLTYLGAFVVSLVMTFVLAHLLSLMNASTVAEGLTIGFWIWLGFYATGQFSSVLWEQKPFKLYSIHTGFSLISLLVLSTILTQFS